MLLNLQMVMHEPWKASAPEVYLLTTTDGSVPRGLDPNKHGENIACDEIPESLDRKLDF